MTLFIKFFDSLKKIRKNEPVGCISNYNFNPVKLIPKRPITLIVEIQNNSDKNQEFIINIISTNFERNYDSIKIEINVNERETRSFLLGSLLNSYINTVSIQIRLFDSNKNNIHEIIITSDKIHIDNENSELSPDSIAEENIGKKKFLWRANKITLYSESRISKIYSKEFLDFLRQIDSSKDQYFIFLDDVIGTGNQFTKNFKKEFKEQLNEIIQIHKSNTQFHFYLIAGIGSFASKKYISEQIELFTLDSIRFKISLNEEDKAFNSKNWKNNKLLEITKKFLKQKDSKWWNGYKDSQLLIVLEWNVPNNTIGCIWNETDKWKPIFPRKD